MKFSEWIKTQSELYQCDGYNELSLDAKKLLDILIRKWAEEQKLINEEKP